MKIPQLRLGVALGLFALYALVSSVGGTGSRPSKDDTEVVPPHIESRGPSPFDLPADCAIIATEAASRLVPTGSWTRIIFILFIDLREHKTYGHSLAVWQPPTASSILIYDGGGALDLGRACGHDPDKIARAWSKFAGAKILEAHFI